MAMQATIEKYRDGELIFRQGDLGDRMYIVMRGSVHIFRDRDGSETPLAEIGFGETFGELALFDQHPRSASARAVGDTEVRVLTHEEFMSLDCDLIIRKIMIALAERLRAIDIVFERLLEYGTTDEEIVRLLNARDWVD